MIEVWTPEDDLGGRDDSGAARTQLVTATLYVHTSRPGKKVQGGLYMLSNKILFHEMEKLRPISFKSRHLCVNVFMFDIFPILQTN